jgi:hypothetical protein
MKLSVIALSLLALAGCSSADQASSGADDADVDGGAPSVTPPIAGSDAASPASGDGAVNAPADGATPPPTGGDGGAGSPDAASGPANAFTGAGPYTATLGPSARNIRHTGPNGNPAGQACLSCHGGQVKNVVPFLAGGTVWKDAAGTTPAQMVEMRVLQANGVGLSAYSDGDGNFFVPRGASAPLASPAHPGVRDAMSMALMSDVINDADCNSCHRAGGQTPLNLP